MAALCDCDLTSDGLSIPTVDACVGHRKLKEALQDHFKYTTFRPGQLEALLPIVHGRDVFARMPTGGGEVSLYVFGPLGCKQKSNWCYCKSAS